MKLRAEKIIRENPFINKTELVYQLLLEEILEGRLTGGQKIEQNEIAGQLNLSRSPIREALIKLCKDGFLIKSGASNYEVYRLRMEDYILLNDFRTMLEVFACEKAVKYANSKDFERIREILNAEEAAVETVDMITFARLDLDFHESMVKAAHNPELEKTYASYKPKFELFDALTLNPDILAVAHQWHIRIYHVLEDRDTAKACELARIHRDNTSIAAVNVCMEGAGAALDK